MMENPGSLQELLDKLIRLRVQLWLDAETLRIRGAAFMDESLAAEVAPWESSLRRMLTGQTREDSCLMPLVPDDGAYRIYGFHSLQGSLTEYRYVAQALVPRTSFYGFQQAPGVHADSMAELAHRYREALLRHEPSGPFALYGVSAGGLLAIEVARLLGEAGRPPELLILGDTFDPAPAQLVGPEGLTWYAWVSFVDVHCGRVWLSLIGRDSPFWQCNESEKLSYLAARRDARHRAPWSSLEQLAELHRSFVSYCTSHEAYVPEVPSVPCIYISAANTPSLRTARMRAILSRGFFNNIEVEGRHLDLVRPSGAGVVAQAIASALDGRLSPAARESVNAGAAEG